MTTQHDDRRPTPAEQDANERAYHRGMAKLTASRGYLNLSQAHALAAKDCAKACACQGCESARRDWEHDRKLKSIRSRTTPRNRPPSRDRVVSG